MLSFLYSLWFLASQSQVLSQPGRPLRHRLLEMLFLLMQLNACRSRFPMPLILNMHFWVFSPFFEHWQAARSHILHHASCPQSFLWQYYPCNMAKAESVGVIWCLIIWITYSALLCFLHGFHLWLEKSKIRKKSEEVIDVSMLVWIMITHNVNIRVHLWASSFSTLYLNSGQYSCSGPHGC